VSGSVATSVSEWQPHGSTAEWSLLERCAVEIEAGDGPAQAGRVLQPSSLGLVLRRRADGLARRGVGHREQGEGAGLTPGGDRKLDRGHGGADEVLCVRIERVERQRAGGSIVDEFDVELVVADLDQHAAMRCCVLVRVGVARLRCVIVGTSATACQGETQQGDGRANDAHHVRSLRASLGSASQNGVSALPSFRASAINPPRV